MEILGFIVRYGLLFWAMVYFVGTMRPHQFDTERSVLDALKAICILLFLLAIRS